MLAAWSVASAGRLFRKVTNGFRCECAPNARPHRPAACTALDGLVTAKLHNSLYPRAVLSDASNHRSLARRAAGARACVRSCGLPSEPEQPGSRGNCPTLHNERDDHDHECRLE